MPRAITPGIKNTNMKSRITIEVDFDNGNRPIIQIRQVWSEDVRDKILQAFTETLAGKSSWLRLDYSLSQTENTARLNISAIPPHELKKEADIMLEQYRLIQDDERNHIKT